MKILAGIISIMIVVLFNVLFKKLLRKEKITIGIIRQPYMYFWSGILISINSIIVIVVGTIVNFITKTNTYEDLLVFIFLYLFLTLSGLLFVWYYLSFKITISDDHFTYRNFWFKTKKYLYKDCFIVYRRARIDIYFKNKRIIKLGFFINNYSELTDKLESKFIPKKKKNIKHLIKKSFKGFKIYNLEYSKNKFELKDINNTRKNLSNILLSVSLNCREDYLKERGLMIYLYLNLEFDYDDKELDKQFQKIAKLMKEEQEKLFFGVIEFVLQYNDGQFKIENISYH